VAPNLSNLHVCVCVYVFMRVCGERARERERMSKRKKERGREIARKSERERERVRESERE